MRVKTFSLRGLLFTVLATTAVYADRLLMNQSTGKCLVHDGGNATFVPCPSTRPALVSTMTWVLTFDDPTEPATSNMRIRDSHDDGASCLGLSATDATVVEMQACNETGSAWDVEGYPSFTNGSWARIVSMAKTNVKNCLGVGPSGNVVVVGCGKGTDSKLLWSLANIIADRVTFYASSNFQSTVQSVYLGTYSGTANLQLQNLLSSPNASVEIPIGFSVTLTVNPGNTTTTLSTGDVPFLNRLVPESHTLDSVSVRVKSGAIIYDQANYFGPNNNNFLLGYNGPVTAPSNAVAGSVLLPVNSSLRVLIPGMVIYESVASLPGMGVTLTNLTIETAACETECTSSGTCNANNGTCTCKAGFAGPSCGLCAPGFFGPNCQPCSAKCSANFTSCDDGVSGTGKCLCQPGHIYTDQGSGNFTCDGCLHGYWGQNCTVCKCGNGTCNFLTGDCTCMAGWIDSPAGKCYTCEMGRYQNNGTCQSCPLGCSGCDESNKCTGCIPSWDSDGAGGCRLHTCPDGSSPPANNTCKSGCAAECALCWGPTDGQCIACNPPWYLMDGFCVNYVSSTGQCTAPLSLTGSWYGIPNKTECGACATPCANCNSLNQTRSGGPICTECAAGWFVQDGECVEQCSDGYYDAGDATCKQCPLPCSRCARPFLPNETAPCLSCLVPSNVSLNGTCKSGPCPEGTSLVNGTCQTCHPDCLTCSGPAFNQCRTCGSARPFLAQNGQCVEVCPKGTYQTNNGTCEACDSSCSSCFGGTSSQCLGCRDPTNVVFQGSCRTCSANTPLVPASHSCDDYVPVHASVLDQSDPNSTSTTNSLAIGFSIGAALLLLLILALVLHRRIMRRRRREATAAFAENAGFRGQREEANQLQKDTETMESIATDITRTLGETNGGTSSPASRSSFPRYTMSSFGEADPAPATPDPVAIQARTKQHRWDQSDVGVGEHDKVEMMAKPTYDGGWPSRQYYPATVQQNSWEMNTLRS